MKTWMRGIRINVKIHRIRFENQKVANNTKCKMWRDNIMNGIADSIVEQCSNFQIENTLKGLGSFIIVNQIWIKESLVFDLCSIENYFIFFSLFCCFQFTGTLALCIIVKYVFSVDLMRVEKSECIHGCYLSM